jgi:hypothetical protein
MQKFSKAEIAKAILEAKRNQAQLVIPKVTRSPLPSERAAEKLVTSWMEYSGLDTKALYAIQEQHRLEWDRSLPKQQAEASRLWARRIKATQAGIAVQSKGYVAAAGNLFPTFFTVDTPQAIFASDDGFVQDTHIEPLKSSAKILVDRTATSVDKLSFLFLFKNVFSTPFLYDFFTVITASGHVALRQKGHFSSGSGYAGVNARIEVTPSALPLDSQILAFVVSVADAVPFWWVDHTEERTFSEGTNFIAQNVLLDPSATASILVSITVDSDFDGRLVADLNTGTFGIQCPLVAVVPRRALPTVTVL